MMKKKKHTAGPAFSVQSCQGRPPFCTTLRTKTTCFYVQVGTPLVWETRWQARAPHQVVTKAVNKKRSLGRCLHTIGSVLLLQFMLQ